MKRTIIGFSLGWMNSPPLSSLYIAFFVTALCCHRCTFFVTALCFFSFRLSSSKYIVNFFFEIAPNHNANFIHWQHARILSDKLHHNHIFLFTHCATKNTVVKTRPDTRLPKSRASGQGQSWNILTSIWAGVVICKRCPRTSKTLKKLTATDGPTDRPTDRHSGL